MKMTPLQPVETEADKQLQAEEPPEDLVPCSKCNRKFRNDRLQKHESICKSEPKKPVPPPSKPEKQDESKPLPAQAERSAKPSAGKDKPSSKVGKLPLIE